MSKRAKPAHPYLTEQDMLDAGEVAALLRMPVSTVLDFARRDVIPGHKIGRRWIFLRDEIIASVRQAPNRSCVPGAQIDIGRAASSPHARRRASRPHAVPAAPQPKLFG
jgi:hypothetical protein